MNGNKKVNNNKKKKSTTATTCHSDNYFNNEKYQFIKDLNQTRHDSQEILLGLGV